MGVYALVKFNMVDTMKFVLFVFLCSSIHKVVPQKCSSTRDYYVASYGNDVPDCLAANRSDVPCASLHYISLLQSFWYCSAIRILDDIEMNTTAIFNQNSELSIVGFSDTSGDGSVSVECEGQVGIQIHSSVGFTLENIHFRNCHMPISTYSNSYNISFNYTSILFVKCWHKLILKCSFYNVMGSAILLLDEYKETTIRDSNFTGNPDLPVNDDLRAGGLVFRTWSQISMQWLLIEITHCHFVANTVKFNSQCNDDISEFGRGGALEVRGVDSRLLFKLNVTIVIKSSVFISNSALMGGAISIFHPLYISLSISDSHFASNEAVCRGGAIMFFYYPEEDGLGRLLCDKCKFDSNRAQSGGGVALIVGNCSNCTTSGFTVEIYNSQWLSNKASTSGFTIAGKSRTDRVTYTDALCSSDLSEHGHGGALEVRHDGSNLLNSSVVIHSSIFDSNVAVVGGAISILSSYVLLHLVDSQFTSNSAMCQGGAVMYSRNPKDGLGGIISDSCRFSGNSASWGGGVAVMVESCTSCIRETTVEIRNSSWVSNSANTSGFAIAVNGGDSYRQGDFKLCLLLSGKNSFNSNFRSEDGSGSIDAENSLVVFEKESDVIFSENKGTAIVLKDCEVRFGGKVSFLANSGVLGGAVLVDGDSALLFGPNCNVVFDGNSADSLGGAIYSGVTEYCTFDVNQMTNSSLVSFGPNSAGLSDQSIYLKSTSKCEDIEELLDNFQFLDHSARSILLPIDSIQITILEPDDSVNLLRTNFNGIKLGQKFYIQPIIKNELGQDTEGIGYVSVESNGYQLVGPSKINLDKYTNNIEFSIRGQEVFQETSIILSVAYETSGILDIRRVSTNIVIFPCVETQEYSNTSQICECNIEEDDVNIKCSKDRQYVCLKKHYWLYEDLNRSLPCPALNCVEECPHENDSDVCSSDDFCIIENSDDVCQDGRTNFLCSECAEDYSFSFEALHCVNSTTCNIRNTVFLSLSLFGYWVVLLIAFLLVLSLKVSVGSGFMFGIIYYFSVASIYTRTSAVLGIRWMQIVMYVNAAIALLDPGFLGYCKLCFIESWKTPLPHELFRLATPLFLMVSVVIFIIIARCCRFPRRFSMSESSPVHAICLLILLSYTSSSFTSWKILVPLPVSNGRYLVQVAPTIDYFHKDFLLYFVIALFVQLFICIPVCLFFLFSPFLSKHVNLVKLRLKPIVDEFHACYKPEYRWFAGFYFLARQIVYLICMTFTESYPQNNSYLTTVNVLVLLTHAIAQPYSKKWLNMIDTILLSDLVVLSIWSPEKTGKSEWGNAYFHDCIPYVLILVPTLYLFMALFTILFKKLILNRCRQGCCRVHFQFPSLFQRFNTKSDGFQLKPSTTTVVDPFSNDEYREPLLEDLDTKMGSDSSSSNYGSM